MGIIYVYTDGGSRNHGNKLHQHVKNTDPAAWAYTITINQTKTHHTGAVYGATNNQMELTAIIKALSDLINHHHQNDHIILTSDSKYFLNAIQKQWIDNWKKNKWQGANHKPIKNKQLWVQIDYLLNAFPSLKLNWTKGHATNQGNNEVDQLLNDAMDQLALK